MIYFVRSGDYVKIGRARDVEARVRGFQTAHPTPLVLIGVRAGERREERELHRRFRPWHVRGEWFEAVPEILAEAGVPTDFKAFLLALGRSDDPLGDFVGDVAEDRTFPDVCDADRLESYLIWKRACPEALKIAMETWLLYVKTFARLGALDRIICPSVDIAYEAYGHLPEILPL